MSDNNENMINKEFCKNKYFYGKLMTVRDFEAEQQYFDEKRYLINSLLHGMGIVCGFTEMKLTKSKGGEKETYEIKFNDGGMALTCSGHEIVVRPGKQKQITNGKDGLITDLTKFPHLYLKYKSQLDGYIAVNLKSSTCEEKCCPSRIVDDFEVVALSKKPDSGIGCNPGSQLDEWLSVLEKNHETCPECEKNLSDMVYLGTVESDLSVIQKEPEKHRILFTSKELYQLLKCHVKSFDSHVSNFKNPHKVGAEQIGVLVSINDVKNPGGNINLLKGGSILIEPNDRENSITIREEHSTNKDNPHEVNALQVKALVSVDGITSPGGNIDLIEGTNIKITPNTGNKSIKIDCTLDLDAKPAEAEPKSIGINNVVGTSKRYAREDHEHKLEEFFVDHSRLSLDLQDQLNVLSMYLRERALKCSVTSFKKVAEEFRSGRKAPDISLRFKKAIREKLYKNENDFIDFIRKMLVPIMELKEEIKTQTEKGSFNDFDDALKDLERTIKEDIPLKVASQLDEVCFFALELKRSVNNPMFSALNCTAGNFRKISEIFKNDISETILLNFETAVNNKLYEKEDEFIDFMRENLQFLKALEDKIKDTATEESLNNYGSAVEKLERAIGSKDALNIAARQEEVCSSASQLERISENLMLKAMKCTAASFKVVYKRFDSDIANEVSDRFEKGLKNKVYENKSTFIELAKTNLEIFNQLSEEATSNSINTIKKDLDNFVVAAEDLKVAISLNDADEIAAKLAKFCSFARELRPANSIYRALRDTAVNFTFTNESAIFKNEIADEISEKFENAVNSELYEDEKEFVNFINANFGLFKKFANKIIDDTTGESFTHYRTSVEKLRDILESNDPQKIAAMQEGVSSSAKALKPRLRA